MTKPIRILFVNAIHPLREVETRYPPLGIGYMISCLRRDFPQGTFECKVVDRDVEKHLSHKGFHPDLVCISSVTQNFNRAKAYARAAKQGCGIPVIVGGIHITEIPENLTVDMDVGVIGEGERKLVGLAKIFLERGKLPPEDLQKVDSIIYWKDGSQIRTSPQELLPDIATLPLPARDLLGPVGRHTYMFTSRGCPYRCRFCASTRFYPAVRWHPADRVAEEVEYLVQKHNVHLISFYDDLFAANRKRMRELAKLLRQRGILSKVRFTLNARADIVDQELCDLFHQMGVVSVNMGLESGCQKTLDYLKGHVTVEQNYNAVDLLVKNRLFASGSFIIGCPQETREDILETYRFFKKIPLSVTDIYVLVPLPGTPVWHEALKRGLVSNDMDWDKIDIRFTQDSIVLSEILTFDELRRLYKMFRRERFLKLVKGFPKHPYAADVPRTVLKYIRDLATATLSEIR